MGNLNFEGEFRTGFELNGKRKDYDKHGNLKFEGEISNGEKMERQKNMKMEI